MGIPHGTIQSKTGTKEIWNPRRESGSERIFPQLHTMDTQTPMEAKKLSQEQYMRALLSLLFPKEKQTGNIKGLACINGAPQHAYIPKEDAVLLTVSKKSTFITAMIAAKEMKKVGYYDIPSTFINTDVDEEVIMILKGELAGYDHTNSAGSIQEIRDGGQEGNKSTLCEIAKGVIWADESKLALLLEVEKGAQRLRICDKPIRSVCSKYDNKDE
jgi:hypothetical protein